jgi:tetratricopeptide (TPR) repeat protein
MKVWYFLVIIIAIGCQKQPYSNDYIYTQKDDHLSLQGKVDLLRESSLVNDDALLTSIALLYAQNRNWIEAKASISRAIRLNPLNPSYHLYLANINAELKDNIEAYEEAKVAFELGTYDEKLEALIARMAIETADTINGSQFVKKYYTSNKNNVEAQLLMARLHIMEKDFSKAESLVEKVLKKDSMNFVAWEIAYNTYLKIDSIGLAIEFGNRLLKVDSTNALYYYQVADLYQKRNEFQKSAMYFAKSYHYKQRVEPLYLALRKYTELSMYDSVLFYSDSVFAGINYHDKEVLINRARAFDRRYKYEESYLVYNELIRMDSTDSVVNAEQQIVQRKIAYLQRKKRVQKQLADSLANAMPIINF